MSRTPVWFQDNTDHVRIYSDDEDISKSVWDRCLSGVGTRKVKSFDYQIIEGSHVWTLWVEK